MSPPPSAGQPRHEIRPAQIDHAIARLTSLHDGEAGLTEAIALGPAAIAALRAVLFAREPSGLPHPRCRAVEALAALKAFDVLADFLRLRHQADDPVERLGDEIVVSAAARAIARLRSEWVYRLLMELAAGRLIDGVLAGLGSFHRKESITVFVGALGEDGVRLTAEAVLLGFGKTARPALIAAARERGAAGYEGESDLRRRRSALGLVLRMGITHKDWPHLRPLLDDTDTQIALLACQICLAAGDAEDRARLPERLTRLRSHANWLAREQIDELLAAITATPQP